MLMDRGGLPGVNRPVVVYRSGLFVKFYKTDYTTIVLEIEK